MYRFLNGDSNQFSPTFAGNTEGFSVRSLFIPQHSYNCVLYRINEHVFANHYSDPMILKVTKVFSLNINEIYHIICQWIKTFSRSTFAEWKSHF